MEEYTDKIFENLNNIFINVKEISDIDPDLGKILLFNFKQAFDIYEAKIKNESYDLSDSITFISELLHINLHQALQQTTMNHNVSEMETNDEITQFIINNSKVVTDNIDEYEKFIKDTLSEVNKSVENG